MFRIKKLDIFIFRQFALLFVGTFVVSLFVLMMQFVWKYIDMLIGKGLTMDVLAEFFGYMSLVLMPEAFPLSILLASLIAFGNLGESSELTAIKSAGISLMQTFRSLIITSVVIALVSFYFQNKVGPAANMKMAQLMLAMKQKSPELEIPEGIFYDGIPGSNLYVQEKNMETGKLYGIMIYRMTGSYEDQAIILADSGMLQSTADKQHLMLSLWSGEWFENMQSQELMGSAAVPYRRESFTSKRIIIEYNDDLSLTDASLLTGNAKAKGLSQLHHDGDSLTAVYDSIGRNYLAEARRNAYFIPSTTRADSIAAVKAGHRPEFNIDSAYAKATPEQRRSASAAALSKVQQQLSDLEFKALITSDGDKIIRQHKIEAIRIYNRALLCIIFFFIGAPLGAIIRKGGLGVPVIIAVLVYILYYILENTGYRMSRGGMWPIWFGMSIAPAVLIPLSAFITYKANNDSVVFNIDLYRNMLMRLLGLRQKHHVGGKEVIINDPDYRHDAEQLAAISEDARRYETAHRLKTPPNVVKTFFRYEPDHDIERISDQLEAIINDLGNTRDKVIIGELNHYPVLATKAHTRPFERRWLNIAAAVLLPVGAFLYLRMWRFRLRLLRDLHAIQRTNSNIIQRIAHTHSDNK
ncbi:MAG: LptF/LptG family permease [Prevotella sp.]|nr:LptF/LptG family permease [Prevotella sp.]